MTLIYLLMFLKCVEALIMLIGIVFIVYYLLHPTKKNIHLSNGRPYIGIFNAIGWFMWTYSVVYADYNFFFNLKGILQSTTVYWLILIELGTILITLTTCMHMLGHEFKWIKKDK